MCIKAVEEDPSNLRYVPDRFKIQEMCDATVTRNLYTFRFISGQYKTQGMYIKVVCMYPCLFEFVPDHLKTQEICDKAVRQGPFSLQYIPNWFVKQEQVKI